MIRHVSSLTSSEFDLIIVGGGIFGICAAWDATLRGLSVALVDKGDFAHATSANCFRMVHGGMRYLQHGDLYRVRESSRERTTLLRIAPHCVSPLPIVVPTYGNGLKGKEFLKGGLLAYDILTLDRNKGIQDPQRRIPHGRSLSRQECLEMFPGLKTEGLTGGVLFYDGQMYNAPRLALSFLKSAVNAGAVVANYVEATGFLREGNDVVGVAARDLLNGDALQIRGKVVLNAAGPWATSLLGAGLGLRLKRQLSFSRDTAFVVNRPLTGRYALAVQGRTRDPDAVMSRGNRHLFMVPWRHCTLIGVWHTVYGGHPDEIIVTREEVQAYLDEFNAAYVLPRPLTLDDVSLVNAGLVLFGDNRPGAADLSYGKRSIVVDHSKEHGVNGLVSVVGVRYTTARGVGEKVVDLVFKKLGEKVPRSSTAETPIYGGQIEGFEEFSRQATTRRPAGVSVDTMHSLLRNHGAAYPEILEYVAKDPSLSRTIGESNVIEAEVVHAVRREMAHKLSDVVFRRTDLGTGGHPGESALHMCADIMASELRWNGDRVERELDEVKAVFSDFARVVA